MEEYLDISDFDLGGGSGSVLDAGIFPALKDMSAVHLRVMETSCRAFNVAKDVELIREGDEPDGLYFTLEGEFAVTKMQHHEQIIAATLHPGEIFGEYGLMREKTRYAGVIATQDSRVAHVSYSAVRQVIEVDKEFKERLTSLMHTRIIETFFGSYPAFHKMNNEQVCELKKYIHVHALKSGEQLLAHGQKPKALHIIISGEVAVEAKNKSDEVVLVDIRRDGAFIGDISFCNKKAHFGTAVSIAETDLLDMNDEAIQKLQQIHPDGYQLLIAAVKAQAEKSVTRLKAYITS